MNFNRILCHKLKLKWEENTFLYKLKTQKCGVVFLFYPLFTPAHLSKIQCIQLS